MTLTTPIRRAPALLVFLLAGTALSQTPDDIIVTATKTQTPVSDIAASISVVDGAALAGFDGAEELSQRVAGLQAAVANGSQIAFQIRGIGAVDHQALTPTATAVYVDGVYQATNVQTSPLLFDMQRAEVLKGPQGTLYGRNASAGAINFVSVRPGSESEGYIRSEIGTFDRVNLNAAATVPVNDALSLRLSGRYLTQGPVIDNVVTDAAVSAPSDAGGVRDEFGLRALAAWSLSDNTDVLFNVHYAEDNGVNASPRNEGRAASANLGDHEISVGSTGVQDTDNEFYGASVEINHNFGQFSLVSLSAFETYNQQYGFDFAGLPSFFGGQNANLSYDRDFDQFSQEIRLVRESDKYTAIAGLYFEAEEFSQNYKVWCGQFNASTHVGSCNYIAANSRVGTDDKRIVRDINGDPVLRDKIENGMIVGQEPIPYPANSLESLINQDRRTAAFFSQNRYSLTSKLDVNFGVRLTSEVIEGSGEGRHYFPDGVMGLNNQNDLGLAEGANKIDENRLSGNLGLSYKMNEDALLYAQYSNGYKSGGFNGEVISNATHFDNAGLFSAETVDTIELGAKLTDAAYYFNIAAFYNDYSDPQARFFDSVTLENGTSVSLNSLSNFSAATSHGIEIDAEVRPLEGLKVYGSVTLQDTEINDTDLTFEGNAYLDGDALPFASDLSLVAGVKYTLSVSDTTDLDIGVNAKVQSEFATGVDGVERGAIVNSFVQNRYGVMDASALWRMNNGISFGLWGRNLSNSDYATSAYRFFGDTTFRGAPRTYGINLGYSY